MKTITKSRVGVLGLLLLGFAMGAAPGTCDSGPVGAYCAVSHVEPPIEEAGDACLMEADKPCMRYRIPLDGNPSSDPDLRAAYIAKFGLACYVSEAGAFNCFYDDPLEACNAGLLVPEVVGAAAHDDKYPCLKVDGTEDYWRQTGPNKSIKIDIKFEPAPRETPLIDVNGVPTAVNGPYRNLLEPQTVKVGEDFYCPSGMFDADGYSLKQREYILDVNKKTHGGEIHSDLAGFTWPCKDNCGQPMTCTEETVLKAGPKEDPNAAQVHHVVRKTDQRGCPWGTNSNPNALVISRRLNRHLWYNYPSAKEVLEVNKVAPYQP